MKAKNDVPKIELFQAFENALNNLNDELDIIKAYAAVRAKVDEMLEKHNVPLNDNKVGPIGEFYAKHHVEEQLGDGRKVDFKFINTTRPSDREKKQGLEKKAKKAKMTLDEYLKTHGRQIPNNHEFDFIVNEKKDDGTQDYEVTEKTNRYSVKTITAERTSGYAATIKLDGKWDRLLFVKLDDEFQIADAGTAILELSYDQVVKIAQECGKYVRNGSSIHKYKYGVRHYLNLEQKIENLQKNEIPVGNDGKIISDPAVAIPETKAHFDKKEKKYYIHVLHNDAPSYILKWDDALKANGD